MSSLSYFNINIKKFYKNKIKYDMIKSLYKILLSYIFINFKKIRKQVFFREKSYLNLDMLIIYIWWNKNINNNNNNIFIASGIEYFKKKIAYICLFENTNIFSNIKYLIYPKLKESSLLLKINKFQNFFNWIYNYLIVNKFTINNLLSNEHSLSLMGLCNNLLRFLKYYYYNYNYKQGYNSLGINFLKSRIKQRTKGSNLLGYKMYLMGRFTRKQRAGHLWFSKGKAPLNTINAFIDFSYFSLSLKNSTINVKIWLYKLSDLDNRYYLRMF